MILTLCSVLWTSGCFFVLLVIVLYVLHRLTVSITPLVSLLFKLSVHNSNIYIRPLVLAY